MKTYRLPGGYRVEQRSHTWIVYDNRPGFVLHVGDAASTQEFLQKRGWVS